MFQDHKLEIVEIAKIVLDYYGIFWTELFSRRKSSQLVHARHVAIFLCRLAGYTEPELGKFFKRDESTINYAYHKMLNEMEWNIELKEQLINIDMRLGNYSSGKDKSATAICE